jgi:hypothetical protein
LFSVTYFLTTTFFLSGSDIYFSYHTRHKIKKRGDGGEDVDRYGGGVDGDDDDYDDNEYIKLNKKHYNYTTRKLPDYVCL